MNTKNYMILLKGEVKTSEVRSCLYNEDNQTWYVKFNNGKTYPYSYLNVEKLTEPDSLDPKWYRISREGAELSRISEIYVFTSQMESYWHICFDDGSEGDYPRSDLDIVDSCLKKEVPSKVFKYIKSISYLNDLRNEVTGEKILYKIFEKISFVGNDVALAKYLDPSSELERRECEYSPIFPFGCNTSQYNAVKNAIENQISVIQGPPGTGKTQTILNIIANILMQGKTVQVVSNNNPAIENIYEKLSSPEYNLGFIAAKLGSLENKEKFIQDQNLIYPDFSLWKTKESYNTLHQRIQDQSVELKEVFDKQEELSHLRQELSKLVIEQKHFNKCVEESGINIEDPQFKRKLSSKQWIKFWHESQLALENKNVIGFWFKIKNLIQYGVIDWHFYDKGISNIITIMQAMYYRTRQEELTDKIKEIESYLNGINKNLLEDFCSQSMVVLKDKLANKYEGSRTRKKFTVDDLKYGSRDFLSEYPVILSTTFSSRTSLNKSVVYDYVIMDEASQVDIATGALALSCAKNAVIVGDTKQLSPIFAKGAESQSKARLDNFNVNKKYEYLKSFLQSILDVIPNVAQTLLREHYRCHPKIINFCNQKFYNNELIIMTQDKHEEDTLLVLKTVQGNHVRDHYNQRQIDVIKKEIMPKFFNNTKDIGIISPYKNQKDKLKKEIENIQSETVHKFQGREKDDIIISTVDDQISDFVDDPLLMNVAVSRAKKRLAVVITGNQQSKERNLTDLIDYIRYNNCDLVDSKVYSIFDYLYSYYAEERKAYLKKHKNISNYDSENLMWALLEEIMSDMKYSNLDFVSHVTLSKLIKNKEQLDVEERLYSMNPATHLDFLIYNKISKKSLLAIEVDGYRYHQENTKQASRDLLKNSIMKKMNIPLLRFQTNGSGEREKIIAILDNLIGCELK